MHRKIDVRAETGQLQDGRSWTLVATVHLPAAEHRSEHAPVLVCLPGGAYTRHYYDLPEVGYSQAAHHVAQGTVVIALDHLGVGDSDIPEPWLGLRETAAANHAALQTVLRQLRGGELAADVEPVNPAAVVGAGHSMGGHIAVCMQAAHYSFDAIAVMGSSMVCTRLPARVAGEEVCRLGQHAPVVPLARAAHVDFDWRYAYHWEDQPEPLVDADMAFNPAEPGSIPSWRSRTTPAAGELMWPAAVAREAAAIDVPVLIAMGERDVCQDPLRELAAFMAARDLALFVGPRMAHMHNFAGTRELLWRRLDAFVGQIASVRTRE